MIQGMNIPGVAAKLLAKRNRILKPRDRPCKKEFRPLWHALAMRRKRTLYGRHLRIANTPMVLFRPKWWFLGHPDFHEVNRAYEREFGRPLDEATRLAHKEQRDWWDKRMGYKK